MNDKLVQERGFTLIETIFTLVIVAVMATMLFTYFGSKSFTDSVNPIKGVQSANSIHQIMEMITADYQGYPRWKPGTTYPASSKVTPIKRNGYYYQSQNSVCTSGTSEPSWTLPPVTNPFSVTVSDNASCNWTAIHLSQTGTTTFIMSLATLRQKIAGGLVNISQEGQTVYYNNVPATGMQYKIIDNRYINPPTSWDNDNAASVGYLKVTIQAADGNEKLTAIFTE